MDGCHYETCRCARTQSRRTAMDLSCSSEGWVCNGGGSEPPGNMMAKALIGTDTSHCRAMWRMMRSPSRRPADGPACQGACLHCDCLCFLFGTVERCGRMTQGPAGGPCARASTASRKPSPPLASTCRRPTGYSSCPMMNEMTAPRLPHGRRLTHRSCSCYCI